MTPHLRKTIFAGLFLLSTGLMAQNTTCPIISTGSVRTCNGAVLAISLNWVPLGCVDATFPYPASITYQEIVCPNGAPTGAGPITLIKAPGNCTATSYFFSGASGCSLSNCFTLTLPAPYNNTCVYSAAGVLPIELINFTARLEGNAVVLNWLTGSELFNDFFVVEKSTDGIRFEPISKVEGHGTTDEAHDYSIMDKSPVGGTNFYRLKQVDENGTESTFEVVSVEFRQTGNIFVAPNPASDFADVTIPASLIDQDATIQVLNLNGQVVFEKSLRIEESVINLDLTTVAAGLYAVNLRTSQESFVKTLVLDK